MPGAEQHDTQDFPRWLPLLIVMAAVAGFAAWAFRGIVSDPGFGFLANRDAAHWISPQRATTLIATVRIPSEITYISQFENKEPLEASTLRFAAFRSARVYLDGVLLYEEPNNADRWKNERTVQVEALKPGTHRLQVTCYNEMGPPLLRFRWPEAGLASDRSWYWTNDGRTAYPVRLATEVEPPDVALEFPTVRDAWGRVYLALLAAAFVGAALALLLARPRFAPLSAAMTPHRVSWTLTIVVLAIGFNNAIRHVPTVGADIGDHIAYIRYLADHGRLPDPSEGLQTFQAPLFYVVGAFFLRVIEWTGVHGTEADKALRLIPVLCAAGMVPLSRRLLALAFPASAAAQNLGLCLTAFAPMLLYKAPVVNNEMPAALLSALSVWLVLQACATPSAHTHPARFALAGGVWGLAALTKVSALVLAAPFMLACVWFMVTTPQTTKTKWLRMAAFGAAFVLTCGWYFLRNQWLFGKMVIGGWDPLIGVEWWQFPGFRTPAEYLRFGEALHRPVYCMTRGVWDGLYAGLWFDAEHGGVVTRGGGPKWKFDFATVALPLALVPTAALVIGSARTLWPVRRMIAGNAPDPHLVRFFCLLVMGAYFASILGHTFVLPYYNAIKSTYALAAVPAIAVLIVGGVEPLLRTTIGRAALCAWLAVWMVAIGAGYWAA